MQKFDWNDLQGFLAVVRAGRLTTAALQLGIDHSTLSRRIVGLEDALGVSLFDRRSSGYVLTAEGERLIADAEAVESLAIRIRSRSDDVALGLTGSVRVGAPEGFGTYFLAPELAGLVARHPQLEIELIANPRMFSLSKREADIAISMTRPDTGRLHAVKLNDYELGVYAARSLLARHAPIVNQSSLAAHTWVGYVEDLMWTKELDYLSHIPAAPAPRIRISNVISQMTAVMGGVGLGALPCFMARKEPELVRILPDEIKLFRGYWLITHAETRDLVRVKVVADYIIERIRAVGDDYWRDVS
ncbi:LysR family transcriptional regulator [Glaciimonas immobilis]|uniref:DNA-binding transcriptional LysR family regulator n=1 Tax=Glaciimonas immobilis TaxID=728004 RepID=A0A840RWH1_9BURK|nr:LysR family transcriptional regulator [Glaciimonas immobilis]KAF3996442.1 LysR family transcriptional regulator [Glaciimonas immobilis]MBB5201216.1 DNA-binding transcriptional LysR family regulator [Glaciimonas immobilis]